MGFSDETVSERLYEIYLASGRSILEKRLLLLPLIWGVFGIGEVLALTYLLGPIINNVPYGPNDKPIGGSVLPVLGFNIAVLLAVISLSLYSLGYWSVDFSARRTKFEIGSLAVLLASLILIWASPVFLFSLVVSLIFLLAVIIE